MDGYVMLMNCKICNQTIYDKLLVYENMPSIAQNLPDHSNLQHDKGVDLQVCQCAYCGTIQLNNEPVSYYREVIRATGISDEMKKFRNAQFSEFINKYSLQGKKIIEIGCGNAENLFIMKNCGADPYGLEYSEKSVRNAKSAGLTVYQGFIDSRIYRIDSINFDGFYMLNFLEHLPDPLETLRGIYNNLNDNSYGIIEVPNMDMFLNNGVFYDFMLDHLFYFTKDTLRTVLQLSGYEVLSCEDIWNDYIISAIVRKRTAVDLSHFKENKNYLISQIDNYISGYMPCNVAVWGAGHQALFIMSMLKNAHCLKYVVDSADFKQGKYTPISHIRIVPPDNIRADPVAAIIIIAGSFSDEVSKIIKNQFDSKIQISILRNHGLEIIM